MPRNGRRCNDEQVTAELVQGFVRLASSMPRAEAESRTARRSSAVVLYRAAEAPELDSLFYRMIDFCVRSGPVRSGPRPVRVLVDSLPAIDTQRCNPTPCSSVCPAT
jgi:hypothetical protein